MDLHAKSLVRQVTLPGVLESVPSNSNRKQGERASRESPAPISVSADLNFNLLFPGFRVILQRHHTA